MMESRDHSCNTYHLYLDLKLKFWKNLVVLQVHELGKADSDRQWWVSGLFLVCGKRSRCNARTLLMLTLFQSRGGYGHTADIGEI